MANLAELDRVITYLEDHPEEHQQDQWVCGTGACLAGTAALLNDYRRLTYREEVEIKQQGIDPSGLVKDRLGFDTWVPMAAERVLGLTCDEAFLLFMGGNDIATLREMYKDMANGESITRTWTYQHAAIDSKAVRKEGACER